MPHVVAVLTHQNAPRLRRVDDGELLVLQSPDIASRVQVVALVVATMLETAPEVAARLAVGDEKAPHDVVLTASHPLLYTPAAVNPSYAADTETGDVGAAFATAAVRTDQTDSTPALFSNPMEPHSGTAVRDGDALTVFDSTRGTSGVAADLATLFGVLPGLVGVRAEHVGGAFGSKGTARPHVLLAAMAARVTGRPVKIALTRQMLFALTGYRTPTIQRMRLGSNAVGKLVAIAHDACSQSSTLFEFAEQTAEQTRHLYGAPNIRTTHRLARLDVPTPR